MEVQKLEGEFTLCKYPKTDYTYSPLSRDRVELAPSQVAMRRRSYQITSNHVKQNDKDASQYQKNAVEVKRRWWPWFLVLLLPAVAYGCYYTYADQIPPLQSPVVDTYKPPQRLQDFDLSKRIAALEQWALNVHSLLKYIDQKLSRLDNFEAQIEQYSLKHLQNNLIQVFMANDNADIVAEKLKQHFDKDYMSKEQMDVIRREIEARDVRTWKQGMGEEKVRQLVKKYLAVYKRQQLEIIRERLKVKEVEMRTVHTGGDMDLEAVKRVVAGMLDIYDADKTGLVDYALESAGGRVVSTKCTELHKIMTKQYSILGMPGHRVYTYTSPQNALTPGVMPGECWAFQGFPGYLEVRTFEIIEVTGFSLEHMSKLLAVDGKIESAPKNFSVYGLHGEMDPEPHLFGDYMYNANGTSIQYFPVKYPKTINIGGVEFPVAYDMIELRVESNHGNPKYTCVYRFRVHGNPLTDICRAIQDRYISLKKLKCHGIDEC